MTISEPSIQLPDRQPEQSPLLASVVQPPSNSQVPDSQISVATTVPGQPSQLAIPVNTPSEALVETMPQSPPAAPPATPATAAPAVLAPKPVQKPLTDTVLEESELGESVSNAGAAARDPGYWRLHRVDNSKCKCK